MEQETDLTLKYRPKTWDEVLGQEAVVKSIRSIIKRKSKHSFLLTGSPGIGKTTVARIIASDVGALGNNVVEIDAATNTGIDAMREVAASLQYKGFGESDAKVVIVDESHALSAAAFKSLLKVVEEPPPHVSWIFCTTEPAKMPVTIKTRCAVFSLCPVSVDLLCDLLTHVCEEEQFSVPAKVLHFIARKSEGSPRQALSFLAACCRCQTIEDAKPLVQDAEREGQTLAQALSKRVSWAKAMKIVRGMKDLNAESIRLGVLNYFAVMALNATTNEVAEYAIAVIEAFSTPYNTSEKLCPLLLSIGQVVIADE